MNLTFVMSGKHDSPSQGGPSERKVVHLDGHPEEPQAHHMGADERSLGVNDEIGVIDEVQEKLNNLPHPFRVSFEPLFRITKCVRVFLDDMDDIMSNFRVVGDGGDGEDGFSNEATNADVARDGRVNGNAPELDGNIQAGEDDKSAEEESVSETDGHEEIGSTGAVEEESFL